MTLEQIAIGTIGPIIALGALFVSIDTRRRVARQGVMADFYRRCDAINEQFTKLGVAGPYAAKHFNLTDLNISGKDETPVTMYQRKLVLLLMQINAAYQIFILARLITDEDELAAKRWLREIVLPWALADADLRASLAEILAARDNYDAAFCKNWLDVSFNTVD